MRARARLVVVASGGRSVVRELRSQAPMSVLPRRGTAAARCSAVTVHLVGSAATPLGDDDVELDVVVGPGAELVLTGVAAAVALASDSRFAVRLEVGDGGSVQYLPEPTVVTRRAVHDASLHASLGDGARLRVREVLVAGRHGEAAGRIRSRTRVVGPGGPLIMQCQDLGPFALLTHTHRVLATEVLVWGDDPPVAVAGDHWSLTPLARDGSLASAASGDAVTARRDLATAVASHPGWSRSVLEAAVRSPIA